MFNIGNRIVKLRKEKNMTQEDLSNLLKVSRQTVSKWESDLITPEISNLILISDVFNCPIDYLIKDDEQREMEYELDDEHLTFGERVIKLRKINHITQEQLADYLQVSRQSIFKWEKNKTYPEIEKLVSLSNIFDCSIDYLLKNKKQVEEELLSTEENVLLVTENKNRIEEVELTKVERIQKKITNIFYAFIIFMISLIFNLNLKDSYDTVIAKVVIINALFIINNVKFGTFLLLSLIEGNKKIFLNELKSYFISILLCLPVFIVLFFMTDSYLVLFGKYLICGSILYLIYTVIMCFKNKKLDIESSILILIEACLCVIPFLFFNRTEDSILRIFALIILPLIVGLSIYNIVRYKCKILKKIIFILIGVAAWGLDRWFYGVLVRLLPSVILNIDVNYVIALSEAEHILIFSILSILTVFTKKINYINLINYSVSISICLYCLIVAIKNPNASDIVLNNAAVVLLLILFTKYSQGES
ncbi:MAG: helix-turn-helix transcriptional regulator [Erysipelotrichaceae bacterium]|nr:helix-turn-helix transcriptional regulator [Erysipelotrichaceae bacterium]